MNRKPDQFANLLAMHHVDGDPNNDDLDNLRLVSVRENRRQAQPSAKPRCPFCGRFVRADGRCVKTFYDDYSGGWEHS
jgi:hypothetical protein